MQFTIVLTTLLSVASAGAINKRYSATLFERASGVCGGLATPLCCQTDVEGVADLNCASAGVVSTTEEFQATCSADGTTAQCCILPVSADGLLCTPA